MPGKDSNPTTSPREPENKPAEPSIDTTMDSVKESELQLSPTSAYNAAVAKRAGYGVNKERSLATSSASLGSLNVSHGRDEASESVVSASSRSSSSRLTLGGSRTEVGTSLVSSNLRSPSLRPSLGESRSEAGTLGLSSTLRASSLLPSVAESRNEAGASSVSNDMDASSWRLSPAESRNEADTSTISRSLRSSSCRPDPARSRNDVGLSRVAMGTHLALRDSGFEHASMNNYRTEETYSSLYPPPRDAPSGFASRNDAGYRRPSSDSRLLYPVRAPETAPGFASGEDPRVRGYYSEHSLVPWTGPHVSTSWNVPRVSVDRPAAKQVYPFAYGSRNDGDSQESYSHPRSAARCEDSNSASRGDGESRRPYPDSRSTSQIDFLAYTSRNGSASRNQYSNSHDAQQVTLDMHSGKSDSGSRASSAATSQSPPVDNVSPKSSDPVQQGEQHRSESRNNTRQAETMTSPHTRSRSRNISSASTKSNRHPSSDTLLSADSHFAPASDPSVPANQKRTVSIPQRFSAERRSSALASMNKPAPFFGKHGSLAQNWVEAGPKASIVNRHSRVVSRSDVLVGNETSRSRSPRGSAASFRGRDDVPDDEAYSRGGFLFEGYENVRTDEGYSRGGSLSKGYENFPIDEGHPRGGSSARGYENVPNNEGHSRASQHPPQRVPSNSAFQRVSIDSLPRIPVRKDKHILTPVTAHTNKCDYCPNHNTTVYQRCNACNTNFCKSCLRKCRDGKHEVDVDTLNWIPEKDKELKGGTGKRKEKEVSAIDRKGKGKEVESPATPIPAIRGAGGAPRINPAYLEPLANDNRTASASEPALEDDLPEAGLSNWNRRGYHGIENGQSLSREPEIPIRSEQSYTPLPDHRPVPPSRPLQPPSTTPSKRPTSTHPETESPGPLIKRAKVVDDGSSTNQPNRSNRSNSAEHDPDATLDDPMAVDNDSAPFISRAEVVDGHSFISLLNRAHSADHDTDATIDDPAAVDDAQIGYVLPPTPPRLLAREPQPVLESQQVQLASPAFMNDPMVVDDARMYSPRPTVAWEAHPQSSPRAPGSPQIQLAIEASPSKEAEIPTSPKKQKLKVANVMSAFHPTIQARAVERAKAREAEKARLAAEEEARKAAEEESRLAAEHAEKLEGLNRFTRHVWETEDTLVEYLDNGDIEGALQYVRGVRLLDAMQKGIKLPPDEDICVILGLNIFEGEDEDEDEVAEDE